MCLFCFRRLLYGKYQLISIVRDITLFGSYPQSPHISASCIVTLSVDAPPPPLCDVIYGWPLSKCTMHAMHPLGKFWWRRSINWRSHLWSLINFSKTTMWSVKGLSEKHVKKEVRENIKLMRSLSFLSKWKVYEDTKIKPFKNFNVTQSAGNRL